VPARSPSVVRRCRRGVPGRGVDERRTRRCLSKPSPSRPFAFFSGDPEKIKATQVLEPEEWVELVEKVFPRLAPRNRKPRSIHAASQLRDRFASSSGNPSSYAWEKQDLAWQRSCSALESNLRANSETARNSTELLRQFESCAARFQKSRTAISDPGPILSWCEPSSTKLRNSQPHWRQLIFKLRHPSALG